MATHSVGGIRAPRLNPFAFPSDTSFRFALLIVFVVCGSLSLYGELWQVVHRDQYQSLKAAVTAWWENFNLDPRSLEEFARRVQPFLRDQTTWKISGVVLTLTLATVIYWFMPIWKIRHKKLQPLSSEDVPEVAAYLEHLCREARLARVPAFMWNPSELLSVEQVSDAVTFGRLGRYYVHLTGGLVHKFYTDQPAFRARVLHELAHLRNADVNKTCFTVALWRAFVVTAVLPSIAILLWRSINWEATYFSLLEATYLIIVLGVVPTLLVLLTRNAVIRIREFYADVRASVWDGPAGSLGRVLEALPPVKRSRWLGMKFHPDPPERRQTLEDTYRLLRLGFWDAFGAGLATATSISSAQFLLLGLFFTPELIRKPVYLFSFVGAVGLGVPLFFISLSAGAVGIGVWRGAFAALVRGQAPHDAGRLGCALALGMCSGTLLLLASVAFFDAGSTTSVLSTAAGAIVFLGSVMALGVTLLSATLFVIFKWVAAAASAWLEVVLYRRSPSLALTISLVIASASLAVWVSGITLLMSGLIAYSIWHRLNLPGIPSLLDLVSYWIVPLGSVLYATTVGLWAFPLAASLWRGKMTSEAKATWAFLEGGGEPLALPAQAPLRPRLALILGLAGGLLFCAVLMLLRYNNYIALWLGRLVQSVDGLNEKLGLLSLSALMQASAAVVAAAWIRRLGALHGLGSASIAGCVITFGWMLFFADYSVIWFVSILSTGVFLALPTAVGVSALAGWIRRPSTRML